MNNRPKRRKSNDNPYTLYMIDNNYMITFKDCMNITHTLEISKEIYNQMNQFELDDIKFLNEYDRHIEHLFLSDEQIYLRTKKKEDSLERIVEKKINCEILYESIDSLSKIQKRRVIKYYLDGKNECEIAKEENATHQSVHISIERGKKKLKEKLKKYFL